MNKIKSFIKQIMFLITPPFIQFIKEVIEILIKKVLLSIKEKKVLSDNKNNKIIK